MNWAGKMSMALGLAMGLSSVAWAPTTAEYEVRSGDEKCREEMSVAQG